MGQYFQEALRQDKPTIALYSEGSSPLSLLGVANKERGVQLLEYSRKNIRETLQYGLDGAKELLEQRFTMLMPAEIAQYLDEVNKKQGISRSEFIRQLIREKMGEK